MTTRAATLDAPVPVRRPASLWRDAWHRLVQNRAAVVSLAYIVLLLLIAVFANVVAPFPFQQQDLDNTDLGPGAGHLFGTDGLGRDELSRLIYGSRISLAVALVDVLIVLVVGVPLGLAGGFFGRWVDVLVMRTVDVLLAFPNLLLVIVVITYLRAVLDQPQGPLLGIIGSLDGITGGLLGVFIALGLVSWLTVARLVRGQVLSLKEKEFIEAARMTGAANGRIIFRHLLPNTLAPVIVAATFTGARVLGRRCRKMIRPFVDPVIRAASMNSFSLSDRTWPRTRRATVSHETRPRAMKTPSRPPVMPSRLPMIPRSGPCGWSSTARRYVITTMTSSRLGKARSTSTVRMTRTSTQRPKNPPARPSGTPTTSTMRTSTSATASEMRLP